MNKLSSKAAQAKRDYHKKWREANKEKIREYNRRHFEKQVQRQEDNERMIIDKNAEVEQICKNPYPYHCVLYFSDGSRLIIRVNKDGSLEYFDELVR